ncbi:MAG: hypothetical protein J6T10_21135 [Methanobrevibacter sp.]|nr:hypothetical protein [Methanobrevibacter sp.]
MKKLTAIEMLKRYELTSAAVKTALIYTVEKRVYMSLLDSLEGLPVKINQRISDDGEYYETLRLDLRQIDLLHLRDKGAALLGAAKDFFKEWEDTKKETKENRGNYVERKIIERYHGQQAKASAAYYESGDAIIAGMEVQIKYQDGTLAKIDTIRNQWNKQKKRKG